ncbi:hypothetical protein ACFQPF_07805 [Fictibacillus iocasae]|uniref:ABC transmembrane type-1 domain-containing protein n=1 Tax=Fictibacillus iocasae TaxID=2715437 RepID=A0ABW2NP67_9BACL
MESWFDSFTVVPMTMIAYFLLSSVLTFENGTIPPPFYQRVGFELFILFLLAVPTVAFFIANETKQLLRDEYVSVSRILGGTGLHILKKHVFRQLFPVLMILFMQQFVQTLIILVHLGVLQLFFGGTIVFFGGEVDSISHEWTGLLGMYYQSFMAHPWVPLIPMIFFSLTIISGNFILAGVEKAYQTAKQLRGKSDETVLEERPSAGKFTFLEERMKSAN